MRYGSESPGAGPWCGVRQALWATSKIGRVEFALRGYCPGASVGAIGHGALDSLVGEGIGIMIAAGIYAAAYPLLQKRVLHIGDFRDKTQIELVHARNLWTVIISIAVIIIVFFLERLS